MKVHFDAQCKGKFWPGSAECSSSLPGTVETCTDPKRVTCERCKKTQTYKDAVRIETHFDAKGKGEYFHGLPECGSHRNKNVTTDPSRVTCNLCKKTKAYKESKL